MIYLIDYISNGIYCKDYRSREIGCYVFNFAVFGVLLPHFGGDHPIGNQDIPIGRSVLAPNIRFLQKQLPVSMAVVTGFVLRCASLNRMRGGHLPGGNAVEIPQGAIHVVGKQTLVNGDVTDNHEPLRVSF